MMYVLSWNFAGLFGFVVRLFLFFAEFFELRHLMLYDLFSPVVTAKSAGMVREDRFFAFFAGGEHHWIEGGVAGSYFSSAACAAFRWYGHKEISLNNKSIKENLIILYPKNTSTATLWLPVRRLRWYTFGRYLFEKIILKV